MSKDNHLKIKDDENPKKKYKELSIVKNTLFWIEKINNKQPGKNAIFARSFNNTKAIPQQLTSNQFFIKSNFHGYGGKSYKAIEVEEKIYLIWIDQLSKALWAQTFFYTKNCETVNNKYLIPEQEPKQLSESIYGNFDSSFVIKNGKILFGLCEINNFDYLFSLNLEKTQQVLNKIKKFNNFAGDLSSNKSVDFLSWLEWDSPYMPWEKNDLCFAAIGDNGEIIKTSKFVNKNINVKKNISFFQPYWLNNDTLVCSEDSSGWWNLLFLVVTDIENIVIKKRVLKNFTEYGSPQWVSGISFFAGSIENLFCLAKQKNSWILEQYKDLICIKELNLAFQSISDFCAFDTKIVFRGFGVNSVDNLFEYDFLERDSHKFFKDLSIDAVNEYVQPESFWFVGFDNKPTHSFIYRPSSSMYKKPPLLLKAHSGPTSCFDGSLNFEVQQWIKRGFFVAEVNYGGSSGFGREYRERLNNKWGVVDSYDCKALLLELIRLGFIDENKVAISGNSAGGLTALNCLFDEDFFKVAICKYPVLDLNDMNQNTHRFEKDYLNSLIGNYSKFRKEYQIRSPIYKLRKNKKPVLFFHGKKDLVISYKQTLQVKEQLIRNNQFSEVIIFENEGHGFKNLDNKKKVLEKSIEFLKKNLDI